MDNYEIIRNLVKLQIATVRYLERRSKDKIYINAEDMNILLTSDKPLSKITYLDAIKNLTTAILNNNCEILKEYALNLKEEILNSNINKLNTGLTKLIELSEQEKILEIIRLKETIKQLTMIDIKTVSEILSINPSTIKQACQQERLLNARKIGPTWLINLYECKEYWTKGEKRKERMNNKIITLLKKEPGKATEIFEINKENDYQEIRSLVGGSFSISNFNSGIKIIANDSFIGSDLKRNFIHLSTVYKGNIVFGRLGYGKAIESLLEEDFEYLNRFFKGDK